MWVIAVTGGIACGKTTLLQTLLARGARVIDADAISRSLTAAGGMALPLVRNAFGDAVFAPDGTLDRKSLADIVFSDAKKRQTLNALIHPMVEKEMGRQLTLAKSAREKLVFLDVPLLFEAGMAHLADEVWCATVPLDIQLSRLQARDRLTRAQAQMRIDSQMPLDEKMRRSDKVIDTSSPIEQTAQTVLALYEQALKEH